MTRRQERSPETPVRDLIVVAGTIAQRPGRGGHAWVFLHYLLGFKKLGYDVLFLDRLPKEAGVDGVVWLREVMEGNGLADSYAIHVEGERETIGVPREEVLSRSRRSVLLLDVMGFLDDDEVMDAAPRAAFLDLDPGFPQMWQELDLHRSFGFHDSYITVGLRVGSSESSVPTCGVEWITTPQPVVLDHWEVTDPGQAYTSVATWRGPFDPVQFRGERYGLRVHQMRRFAKLPAKVDIPLEVALEIDQADRADVVLLEDGGWQVISPSVAHTTEDYRRYVQGSRGELGVAKDMYVRTRGGWFSDRSACYLASGRPVLAQATGFEHAIETGLGLLHFSNEEEAAEGLEELERDHPRHRTAARELAEAVFDSDIVLNRLLEVAA